MNYPLALAILGFVAQGHLHQHAIHEQSNYSREYRPLDGAGFVARLEHLSRNYDPAVVAVQLNLLDSHDTPRFLTLCSGDRAAYRLAVLTLMTYPGAPCIYYGDEIGMEGHHDPDCRRSFPWDRERWDVSLRDFVMDATALRHANSALRVGTFRVLASDGLAVAYERADAAATFVVALNAAEHAMEIAVPLTADCAERRLVPLLSTSGEPPAGFVGVAADGNARIPVAARSGLVLRVE
jgi:neopullulanase